MSPALAGGLFITEPPGKPAAPLELYQSSSSVRVLLLPPLIHLLTVVLLSTDCQARCWTLRMHQRSQGHMLVGKSQKDTS